MEIRRHESERRKGKGGERGRGRERERAEEKKNNMEMPASEIPVLSLSLADLLGVVRYAEKTSNCCRSNANKITHRKTTARRRVSRELAAIVDLMDRPVAIGLMTGMGESTNDTRLALADRRPDVRTEIVADKNK